MTRRHIGRVLLVAGAALNIVSMLFPWEDQNNHYYKITFDYEYFVGCVQDGAVLDGLRLFVEGIACISPSVLGGIVLLGALLPRGRANALVSSVLHVALLLTLVAVAGILFAYDFRGEGGDRRLLFAAGAGAAVFVVLAFVEIRLALKSVRRDGGSGDAVHVVPLTLFLAVGTALAIALHGSDVWHSGDYAMIGAGSALGLVGVWLRRGDGSASVPPKSPEPSSEIPLAP